MDSDLVDWGKIQDQTSQVICCIWQEDLILWTTCIVIDIDEEKVLNLILACIFKNRQPSVFIGPGICGVNHIENIWKKFFSENSKE